MNSRNCLNCEKQIVAESAYCHHCGQALKESKLSLIQIIKDSLSNFFNLDGRFFLTMKDLIWPSKLTQAYVAGKRKKYMNPAKMFVFSLILLITVLLMDLDMTNTSLLGEHIAEDVALAESKKKYNQYAQKIHFRKSEIGKVEALRDSVYRNIDPDSLYLGQGKRLDLFGLNISDYKITKKDALKMSGDELLEAYEIEGFWPRLYVKQYHKLSFNSGGGLTYLIKNLTWVILVQVFIMGLIMKLFYLFRGHYYVEHIVLLLYTHSFLFILTSIFLLLFYYFGDAIEGLVNAIGFFGIPISIFLALKKYYKQGYIMTFLKFILISISYIVSVAIVATLGVLISFTLF